MAKFHSSGKTLWVQQFGSTESDSDVPSAITVDESGDAYVVGRTDGAFDGNTSAGNRDFFVAKFDSTGEKRWIRQLGTHDWNYADDVVVDQSGHVYVTGVTGGVLGDNSAPGLADFYVAKFLSNGETQWIQQLGTSEGDSGSGIAIDDSGNLYVVGDTYGTFEDNASAGSSDVFIARVCSDPPQTLH